MWEKLKKEKELKRIIKDEIEYKKTNFGKKYFKNTKKYETINKMILEGQTRTN